MESSDKRKQHNESEQFYFDRRGYWVAVFSFTAAFIKAFPKKHDFLYRVEGSDNGGRYNRDPNE
jgi:hypothetical protein